MAAYSESVLSVLAIAVYRYILICVDPFGTRSILTTFRCVAACVISWACSLGIFASMNFIESESLRLGLQSISFVIFSLALLITGICYGLVYRDISRHREGVTKERIDENKRVLRTFALVYSINVVFWTGSMVGFCTYFFVGFNSLKSRIATTIAMALIAMNLAVNSAVYWWRLKEFRAAIPIPRCCRGNEVGLAATTYSTDGERAN